MYNNDIYFGIKRSKIFVYIKCLNKIIYTKSKISYNDFSFMSFLKNIKIDTFTVTIA